VAKTQKKAALVIMDSINSIFSSVFKQKALAVESTLLAPMTSPQRLQLEDEAWTKAAYNLAQTVDCEEDHIWIRTNIAMDKPCTTVNVDGCTHDTCQIGSSWSKHQAKNNNIGPQPVESLKTNPFPLRPHKADHAHDSLVAILKTPVTKASSSFCLKSPPCGVMPPPPVTPYTGLEQAMISCDELHCSEHCPRYSIEASF
jgi:hypothetical protein